MGNKKVVALIVVLALLAAVLIGRAVFFKPGQQLQIINSSPYPNQTGIKENKIKLEFNQTIETVDFTVNPTPNFALKLTKQDNNLTIEAEEALAGETAYQIEIISSADNFYFNLPFKTAPKATPTPAEESGRGDPNAQEELAKRVTESYPLFYQTPKRGENWAAFYTDKLELTVQYKKGVELTNVKEAVQNWMKENDVTPASHEIVWQEIAASAVPGPEE